MSALFTLLTIVFYYRKDKYEPEPLSRILFAFLLGVFSVIPALIIEIIVSAIGGLLTAGILASDFMVAVFIAPPVEEFSKAIMVAYLAKHRDFDGPLDGLIYGAMVGSGFAMAENIFYGLNAFSEGSLSFALGLTFIRGLTQIVGHPLYTGIAGIGIGGYKVGLYRSKYEKIKKSIGLHMLWNFSASLTAVFIVGFIALLLVMVYGIKILRTELKFVTDLDRIAYESGYYQFKNNPPPPQSFPSSSVPQQFSPPPTQPPAYITCSNCNNVYGTNNQYCPFCGIPNPSFVPPVSNIQTGKCAVCNAPLLPTDTQCRRCGSVVASIPPVKTTVGNKILCPACGNENETNARYCRFCGTQLNPN